MTDTPPTRAPRPRTAPATSEPGPEVGPTGPNAPTGPTETREPNAYEANRELFEELDRESKAAHEALEADDWDAWATHAGRGAELHKQIAERLGWDTSAPRYDTEEAPPMPETAPRPDVPDELINAALDVVYSNGAKPGARRVMREVLATVLPIARKAWFTEIFGTPEEIAAREAEAVRRGPDDVTELCERAAPGQHARRVREQVTAELTVLRDGVANPDKPYNEAFVHALDCAIREITKEAR